MKRLNKVKDAQCMGCLDCVRECSITFYKEFDADLSCIQVIMKKDKPTPSTCVMCGKCAKACEQQAITQNAKGVYTINKKLCIACGKCVEACPLHLVVLAPGASSASKCIACGKCAKACPMEVLEVIEK